VLTIEQVNNTKDLIIKILREHPEGLMLSEIAELTGMNRLTVTKYVHELIGSKSIFQKRVAAARVCYLREYYPGNNEKHELLSGEE
jgi:predicted transcriptional regulator